MQKNIGGQDMKFFTTSKNIQAQPPLAHHCYSFHTRASAFQFQDLPSMDTL